MEFLSPSRIIRYNTYSYRHRPPSEFCYTFGLHRDDFYIIIVCHRTYFLLTIGSLYSLVHMTKLLDTIRSPKLLIFSGYYWHKNNVSNNY